MKKTILSLLAIAATVMFASCNKSNPEEDLQPAIINYPAAAFTLSAVETRAEVDYAWTISDDGKTDSVAEELDEMYVTTLSRFTLTVTPAEGNAGSFSGVNVRSSNPKAVAVEKIDATTFILKRPLVPDGREATIDVWNGDGTEENRISFKVNSCQIIHPEYLCIEVDDVPMNLKLDVDEDIAWANSVAILTIPESEKTKEFVEAKLHKVVFKGLLPENCAFDGIRYQVGTNENWLNYLKDEGHDFNLSWERNDHPNYKPIFPSAEEYFGEITALKEHNTAYVACPPEAMVFASQFQSQLISIRFVGTPIYRWNVAIHVNYPFADEDELKAWVEGEPEQGTE